MTLIAPRRACRRGKVAPFPSQSLLVNPSFQSSSVCPPRFEVFVVCFVLSFPLVPTLTFFFRKGEGFSQCPRLNDDVLLEIFLHLCAEKPYNAYPKYPYPALQLSLVCSRWRAVSLYSNRLWTNITVLISTPAPRDGDPGPDDRAHYAMKQEEITNLYVQRSQGRSISIFVCRSTKAPPPKNPPPAEWIFPISDRQISLFC